MNPNQIPKPEASLDEIDMDSTASVDDFIKELEAKEKDLHITADLTIEIEESDFDVAEIPEFVQQELPANPSSAVASGQNNQQVGLKTKVYELEKEVETLQNRIVDLRSERNDIQEKSDRRLKDFENYKYRMDRERRGSFIDQISNLATQMLPVLDNLDRAIDSLDKDKLGASPEFQQFFDGIVLVNQQVNEVFGEMGVKPIATVGETFDPNFHEAVAVEEREDIPANTILEEMLCGYRIGNRVIRHSMVKVTTAPPPVRKDLSEESVEDEIENSAPPLPETLDLEVSPNEGE